MAQDRLGHGVASHGAWLRAGFGAALAVLAICSTTAARAGDDDGDEPTLTQKFMKTLGLKDPRDMEYGINYGERSPLVVPPTRDLPAPTASTPPPNWPKDADVKKRQANKEKKKEVHPVNWYEESLPLRPDQLDKGRGANRDDGKMASPDGSNEQRQSNPQDLAGKKSIWDPANWFKKEEYATFTGEPARTNLTDPPPGYQTPSPDQPYGVGSQVEKNKVKSLPDRMEDTGGH